MGCIVLSLSLMLAGCATTQRPVFYPNAKLKRVGNEIAQRDADDCMRLAEQYGVSPGGGEKVARGAGEGAAIGGATGAVAGVIRGRNVGGATAAGAAIGGTAGGVRGAVRSDRPSQPYRGFVQRCLRERSYDVIGWQ
ncbi:MAG: glycine zipper family protein [Betaproteobacteria bacterium]|nr:glycine zipper family protein [Betaproteobacteria bacterium]